MEDKKEAVSRIARLREVINHHNYLYHVLDNPEISDAVFDSLKKELKELEQKYPDLVTLDSPTQRVGGRPLDKFVKVAHKQPMLSIDDAFEEEELKRWFDYIQKLAGEEKKISLFCEHKIDGLAASLIYRKGILVQGATRGDGYIGEDVTGNLKTVGAIPLRLSIKKELPSLWKKELMELIENGKIEIRGEIYLNKKDFEIFNQQRVNNNQETYANPRNLAAGSIRQLDPRIASQRRLKFMAYDLMAELGQQYHSQEHQILEALGFKVDKGRICKSLNEVIDFWHKIHAIREEIPYQIDGLVLIVDDNAIFKSLGTVGKGARGTKALKFIADQATTKINKIIWQVGRTGAVTPVAEFLPINIGGVVVTRATLHNADEIKRLNLKIGDTVIVERSGDVIPKIIRVLEELRDGSEKESVLDDKCPVCNHKLFRPEGEVIWRCINTACSARQLRFLSHFVSRKAFDIGGLGPRLIEKLYQERLIKNADDIFRLKEELLIGLEGLGQKSANNLIKSIQSRKIISFDRFLTALGMPMVGTEKARQLATCFKSIESLVKTNIDQLKILPDIGPETASAIKAWMNDSTNLKLISNLIDLGIEVTSYHSKKSNQLEGQRFVITGIMNKPRSTLKDMIEAKGGQVSESVSSQINYVLVGQNPGQKFNKAKELGVKIISEDEFEKMIHD